MDQPRACGLCGHVMLSLRSCGFGAVNDTPLCHADDHDCYRAWTVYGIRPDRLPVARWEQAARWFPDTVRESIELARAAVAADELVALGQEMGLDDGGT